MPEPTDEVITHAAVLESLPLHVREALVDALPPEQRGWWYADERTPDYEWLEVRKLSDTRSRYLRGRRTD